MSGRNQFTAEGGLHRRRESVSGIGAAEPSWSRKYAGISGDGVWKDYWNRRCGVGGTRDALHDRLAGLRSASLVTGEGTPAPPQLN